MQASTKIAGAGAALPASKLRPLPLSATKTSNAVGQEVQSRNGSRVPGQPPSTHQQQQQQQQKQQEQGPSSHLHHQGSQQMGSSGKENAQPRNAAMMGLRDKMVEQIAAFQRRGRSRSPPVLANHQQEQQQQPQKQQEQEQKKKQQPAVKSCGSALFEHRPLPEVPREDEILLLRRERDSVAAEADALSSELRAYKEQRARLVFDLDASHARAEQLKREKEATLEALRNRTRQAEEIADALEHCRGERDAAQRAAAAAPQSAELAAILDECKREVGEARRREAEALAHAEVARCERDDALRRVEALLRERDDLAHAISSSTSAMSPLASPPAEAAGGNCSVGSPSPSLSKGGGAAAASPRLAWSLSPASSRGGSESPSPTMFASGDEEHLNGKLQQQQQQQQQYRDHTTSLGVTIHGGGGGGRTSRHPHAHIAMMLSPVPEERMRAVSADSDASSSSRACGTSATPARRAIAFVSRLAAALSTRRIPSRSAVLSAWHQLAHSSSKGRRQAEVMSQRSQVMALRVGWCAWCCHTSVMIATRREVESAEGRLQGADARVEIYKGAIVSAAARRERDAIRRRVMQVMSANARWKGASREAARRLCAIASRVSSLASMLAWRRIASERRISLRRVARTSWRAWRVQTSASTMRQALEEALCRAALASWRRRAASCLAIASFYEVAQGRCERRAKAAAMRAWRVEVEVVSLRIWSCLRRSIVTWDSAVCVRDCLSGDGDATKLVSLWRRAAKRKKICGAFRRWRLEAGRGRGGRREREWEEREKEREELEHKLKSAEGALILLLDSGLAIGPAQQQRHLHPQPSRAIM